RGPPVGPASPQSRRPTRRGPRRPGTRRGRGTRAGAAPSVEPSRSAVRGLLLLLRVLRGLLAGVRQRLRDVVELRLRSRPVAALELLGVGALPRHALDLGVQVLHRRADLVRLLLEGLTQPAQLLDVSAPHATSHGVLLLSLDPHPAWTSSRCRWKYSTIGPRAPSMGRCPHDVPVVVTSLPRECDVQLARPARDDEEAAPGREVRPADPAEAGAEQGVAVEVARREQEPGAAGLERLRDRPRLPPRRRLRLAHDELLGARRGAHERDERLLR